MENLQYDNREIYDDLYIKCRSDFNNHIIPLIKKDHCECCGSTDNLELHHDKQFIELLQETLNNLNLDINNLTEQDIKNIRLHMLGLQVKIKYKTLCQHCHDIEHQKNVVSLSDKVDPFTKKMTRKSPKGDGEPTAFQKIWSTLKELPVGVYKTKDIKILADVNDRDFERTSERHPEVKEWLDTHRISKGKYEVK